MGFFFFFFAVRKSHLLGFPKIFGVPKWYLNLEKKKKKTISLYTNKVFLSKIFVYNFFIDKCFNSFLFKLKIFPYDICQYYSMLFWSPISFFFFWINKFIFLFWWRKKKKQISNFWLVCYQKKKNFIDYKKINKKKLLLTKEILFQKSYLVVFEPFFLQIEFFCLLLKIHGKKSIRLIESKG